MQKTEKTTEPSDEYIYLPASRIDENGEAVTNFIKIKSPVFRLVNGKKVALHNLTKGDKIAI